jgi:sulfite reductase alpha subunit-like flavoprotein
MVGPGSGIAPMRAFCQEREHMIQDGTRVGGAMLFFGCRRPNEDFIYKDELEAWTESGAITDLVLAFSRETKQKVHDSLMGCLEV